VDTITENTAYFRDILLLNISFFAAVYGRIVKTKRYAWITKFRNRFSQNRFIAEYCCRNGIKQ